MKKHDSNDLLVFILCLQLSFFIVAVSISLFLSNGMDFYF